MLSEGKALGIQSLGPPLTIEEQDLGGSANEIEMGVNSKDDKKQRRCTSVLFSIMINVMEWHY